MIKNILLVTLVSLSLCSAAHKTEEENLTTAYYKTSTCKSSFPKTKLVGENNVNSIERFLVQNLLNLNNERTTLKLNYVNESPGGFHYSFTQIFNGVEIYQSEMKVNVDRKNIVRSVFDNSENTSGWVLNTTGATDNSVIALHPVTHLPVLAEKRIDTHSNEILEVNGEIIFQHSLRSYFAAPDSLVSGKVFNPDPLTTSQNYYGAPYINNNDSTNASLDAELQTVTFKANFNGTQFTLESPYVRVSDFDLPAISPVASDTPYFYFNRSQSGFEDVNAFYHISKIQEHIHSLGFTSADGLVEVDPHAVNGADQSYFAPTYIPPRIFFGSGGVDDAEDADVCVHEYAHFISESSSPGSNTGHQRTSLDEGFGDYVAGSYSRDINTFNEYWTFNWDGHNSFWKGRVLNTCRTYPDSLTTSIYRNGEIWASALFAVNHDIGRNATDSLILETHFNYAANISMADAALLLLEADTTLNGGAYYNTIYTHLARYGFVPGNAAPCIVGIDEVVTELNVGFTQNGFSFMLFNPSLENLQLNILNINGQLVSSKSMNESSFSYMNDNLSAGVYLVQVKVKDAMKTFKWCKAQ